MKKFRSFLLVVIMLLSLCASANTNPFIGRWETSAYGTAMWVDFYGGHIRISIPGAGDEYERFISYEICEDGQVMLNQGDALYFTTPEIISENEMIFDGMHLTRESNAEVMFEFAGNGDGTVEITGCIGIADPLVIPEEIDGQKVTGIASRAFAGTGFSQIHIPGSVGYIGDEAFEGSSIKSLVLPEGIQYIGQDIVENCSLLTEMRLPQSLKWENIMPQDFSACHESLMIYLPGETGIKEQWATVYPQTTTQIYMSYVGTWRGGNHYGEDVTLILSENGSATMCTSYSNEYKFEYHYSWVETPTGISLHGMTTIELEYRYNSLWGPDYSLGKDQEVQPEIELPKAAPDELSFEYEIKEDGTAVLTACKGWEGLETIELPAEIDGYPVTEIGGVFRYRPSLGDDQLSAHVKEVIIPYGVETIASGEFYLSPSIEKVVLPETLKTIDVSAFSCCTALREINLPSSLTILEDDAFSGCTSLERIVLPDGLTYVSESLFKDCNALTEVILPESLLGIDKYAFEGCTSLESVNLPDSITKMDWGCFAYCSSLHSVVLPASLETLIDRAFYYCTSLEDVYLPDGLISLEASAFEGCTLLTEVSLPDSLQNIGINAFDHATHVYIGDNVIVQIWAMGYGYSFTMR